MAQAKIGQWVLYAHTVRERVTRSTLGGPWVGAQIVAHTAQGYSLGEFVASSDSISKVRSVRKSTVIEIGDRENIIAKVVALTMAETAFIEARDALRPRFQARVNAILDATTNMENDHGDQG